MIHQGKHQDLISNIAYLLLELFLKNKPGKGLIGLYQVCFLSLEIHMLFEIQI